MSSAHASVSGNPHDPPRGCWVAIGVLVLLLGSCAAWSSTSGSRDRGHVVQAVEEGARPERFPSATSDEFKHSLSVRDEFEATLDVPDRYEVEMIGGTRQVGVSHPKRFAWFDRYAKDGGRLLNAGLVVMWEWGSEYRIIAYYPVDELDEAIEWGLPSDVAAFARRKLAESR